MRKATCEQDLTLTKTGGERGHASFTVLRQAVKEGVSQHAELPQTTDIVQGREVPLLVEVPQQKPTGCTRKSVLRHIDHGVL